MLTTDWGSVHLLHLQCVWWPGQLCSVEEERPGSLLRDEHDHFRWSSTWSLLRACTSLSHFVSIWQKLSDAPAFQEMIMRPLCQSGCGTVGAFFYSVSHGDGCARHIIWDGLMQSCFRRWWGQNAAQLQVIQSSLVNRGWHLFAVQVSTRTHTVMVVVS